MVNCTFFILLLTDRIDDEQEEKLKSSVPDLLEGENTVNVLNFLWAIFFFFFFYKVVFLGFINTWISNFRRTIFF